MLHWTILTTTYTLFTSPSPYIHASKNKHTHIYIYIYIYMKTGVAVLVFNRTPVNVTRESLPVSCLFVFSLSFSLPFSPFRRREQGH